VSERWWIEVFWPPDQGVGVTDALRTLSADAGACGSGQRAAEPVFGLTHNVDGFPHQNVSSVIIVGKEGA